MKKYKWGIIGPGKIAEKFANTLNFLEDHSLGAVLSRDLGRARVFKEKFNGERAFENIEEFVESGIDAIYIATPHAFHHDQAIYCLRSHLPVLCEKPMAVSFHQVSEMVNTAREEGTFLMEAMWTRFIPTVEKAIEWINSGVIGEIKFVRADFGFEAPFNPESRLYNLNLGGGSLLDVGIYPVFLSTLLLGEPMEVKAMAQLAKTGADTSCQAILNYEGGRMAHIHSSITYKTGLSAEIAGSKGTISFESPWYKGDKVQLTEHGAINPVILHLPLEYNGFEYQVKEVAECIEKKWLENPKMPLSLSLKMSKVMDQILEDCQVAYPAY